MGPFGAGSGLLDGGGKDDPQRGWCGMMMKYAEGSSWHAYLFLHLFTFDAFMCAKSKMSCGIRRGRMKQRR
jgi:hypothetical protein